MTIASEISRVDLVGNGVNDTFTFTFEIYVKTDLLVYVAGELQEVDVNYTIADEAIENPDGGDIVFGAEYIPALAAVVSIILNLPITQLIDYVETDKFPAETHERGLDRLVKIAQRLKEIIGRQLSLLESSQYSELTLPDPVGGEYLRWKADLSGLENIADSGTYGDSPHFYSSIMIGNETFIYSGSGNHLRCFLDPGGANRNFDPSGSFLSGFKVEIVNTGEEIITFDSGASAQNIGPGQLGTFLFDGTNWH